MSTAQLSLVATDLIESYGHTAQHAIAAYRAGGEHIVHALEQRWNAALEQSRTQLTAEVARNATAAQQALSGYTAKSLIATTDGAQMVVNQLVKLASSGVWRVTANVKKLEEKTGITTLHTLAQATLPSAKALGAQASLWETKSAEWVHKMAGNATQNVVKRASAFRKARAASAA